MSNPPNILSTFRSHSYYHVLALCDRSATADALADADDMGVWSRIGSTGDFGKWSPQEIPKSSDGTAGRYSIVIHGATDADLGIDSYKITSYTAASATAGDKNTSIATEGEITITEPKGVVFFDLLVSLMTEMNSDATTCCFVLKTFFVGHAYDPINGEHSSTITDVAPVMFLLTDAAAVYTEAGGVYTLQILSLANGASRLPQFARAADGASIHLDKAANSKATVKQALDTLFNVVRQNYRHHYDCVIAVANQKKIKNPNTRFFPVEYIVEVDPEYTKDIYIVTDAPVQYKTHGSSCTEPVSFKNKLGASIEDAIHRIMSMCPQVKKDMVDGVGDGPNAIKYEYKIHSAVETKMDGDNKRTYVKYSVKRFMSPRGFNIQQLLKNGGDGSATSKALRENLIEFDYIFTGKNVDILEFNIQMNYGLSYLQMATTSNSFKQQFEAVASRSRHISVHSDVAARGKGEPVPVPVFFSPQLKGLSLTNTADPGLSTQAGYNMAKHASLEVAEASVKIIGNPRLYSSVMATTHPANLGKQPPIGTVRSDAPGAPKDTPTLEYSDFKHWSQLPALAVINIKMPTHNDDVALLSGTKHGDDKIPPDYAKNFWYGGYYYVYGIEHSFDNGEFTQQLLMVAMPNGSLLEKGDLKSESEQPAKTVVECYTSMIADNKPSGGAPPPTPTVPHAPDDTKKEVEVTTKADADTITATAVGDPTKVKDWNKATPAVQQAILQASAHTGVDATLMAQLALIESSYRPTVTNKAGGYGTATGLYQHIDSTWMRLVKANKIPGIAPNTPDSEALPLRTNPQHSAHGGAAYIQLVSEYINSKNPGDIYLAYFAGEGAGRLIIKACDSGRGGDSLESTLGNETAFKMKRANPQLAKMDTQGVRDWAAMRVASTLNKGVTVAKTAVIPPSKPGTQSIQKTQAPANPTPVKGKSAAERVSEITNKTPLDKDNVKKPCGTVEPPRDATAALNGGP